MNSEELQAVFDETYVNTQKLLVVKGGEYAGNEDRLGNFKRGADRVGIHPLQILWIYAAKHIDALETYVRDTAAGLDRPRSESIEGRFDDLINYCILAKALIREAGEPKPAVVADRDSDGDSGRVSRELPADAVRPAPLVALSAPYGESVPGYGDPVHSMEPPPRVQPPPSIQLAARKAPELTDKAAIVSKAGGEKCLTCYNAHISAFSWPCNICVKGNRFSLDQNGG